uniref:Cell elongation protein diminuto n=1 Tax=Cajanus cajan TaxID=3821 RepID=A0A151TMT0_CAJCA|nr:Cell elongation protein diminuto [Cajanus cajan]
MSDLEAPLRPKRKKIWVDYFVSFRWIIVIFVVLPISFTLYFLTYLGDVRSEWKSYKTRQKEHDENVKKVIKRLKQRNPSKDGLVCTARKPWIAVGMRNVDYKRARHFEVDLSAFRNVLEIDKERMIARVEPLVNMGQITRVTGVMMTGRYASKEEAKKKGNKINSVGWWYKTWFYQHAETALKKGEFVEYIPTREYYHRHTRCLYWEGKLILPFADQWWFRFLFGWLMPPKVSLLKATQGEAIRNYYHEMHVIQDLLVPLYKVGDALEWVHREMEVYPIWLCPHKLFKLPVKTMIYPEPGFELHRRQGDTPTAQMYTDVGVYYAPGPVLRGEVFDGAEAVRKLENWLIENHGFQPQYAVSELSEKNFWRMFDAGLYEHARRKYGAVGTFMSLYYKSKKGRKTEKEVQEEEQAHLETAHAEVDQPVD